MEKTIGILGGMGPKATADLFNMIVDFTPAEKDQDHIHILIDNNPKIADRTSYILGHGDNPLEALIEGASNLRKGGADFIIIPCNTAHYFYDSLTQKVDIPILNMIEEVGYFILNNYGKSKIGLLATTGTYEGRVYEKYLNPLGIEVVSPSDEIKDITLDLIYKVKAGKNDFTKEELDEVLNEFKEKGIDKIILGCTELPLVFHSRLDEFKDFIFLSSTDILARKAIEIAKNN